MPVIDIWPGPSGLQALRAKIITNARESCKRVSALCRERPVLCRVSHEALRDLATRVHFEGPDEKVFEAYRELIEQVASDAYDAGTSVDDAGLVLVTSEALARVGRSA